MIRLQQENIYELGSPSKHRVRQTREEIEARGRRLIESLDEREKRRVSGGQGRLTDKISILFVRCFVWLKILVVAVTNQFCHFSTNLILHLLDYSLRSCYELLYIYNI